mmetsp:Transcript_30511/g.45152  ORF Transcript_30511/g.45152 Transcript_30511/m.45152 type:complete len:1792 (+) Transcript_30511:81-5456(+)
MSNFDVIPLTPRVNDKKKKDEKRLKQHFGWASSMALFSAEAPAPSQPLTMSARSHRNNISGNKNTSCEVSDARPVNDQASHLYQFKPHSPASPDSPTLTNPWIRHRVESLTETSPSALSTASSTMSSGTFVFGRRPSLRSAISRDGSVSSAVSSNLAGESILFGQEEDESEDHTFFASRDIGITHHPVIEEVDSNSFDLEAQSTGRSDDCTNEISFGFGSISSSSRLETMKEWTRNAGNEIHRVGGWTQQEIRHLARHATCATKRVFNKRPAHQNMSPIMEPWEDLKELQKTHKDKIEQMKEVDHEEHYDFALVLTAQPVYSFWADRLDFRTEHLGAESLTSMPSTDDTAETDDTGEKEIEDKENEEPTDHSPFLTPQTGIRRRKRNTHSPDISEFTKDTHAHPIKTIGPHGDEKKFKLQLSDGLDTERTVKPRLSMFERAVGIFSPSNISNMEGSSRSTPFFDEETPTSRGRMYDTPGMRSATRRRRWGNRMLGTNNSRPDLMSPPIRSVLRNDSSIRKRSASKDSSNSLSRLSPLSQAEEISSSGKRRKRDSSEIDPEGIPSHAVPRGIAKRNNGMLMFLSALKKGIVLRCHRPGSNACFVKIYSSNGGDSVRFEPVAVEDAMLAFQDQRTRFNKKLAKKGKIILTQPWSRMDTSEDIQVPDFIAEERRRERVKGLQMKMLDTASRIKFTGKIKTQDVIAVHPGIHLDPRFQDQYGTSSLRQSKSRYDEELSFSIIMKANHNIQESKKHLKKRTVEASEKWHSGEGNDSSFKIVNFEAATAGEYWLAFRGFLLLHRDAASGRFARHRAGGFGGNYKEDDVDHILQLQRDVYHEPRNIGILEKLVAKIQKEDLSLEQNGASEPGAVAPPSDYFIGFRSPGTQIWSRLRLAGLETNRIYALDHRRVMIKVRCPIDRLTDVAEVLKIKLRTKTGSYAPFRENSIDLYQPLNDELDAPKLIFEDASLFRSSERQKVIDFIIKSRIRDTGAELGETTKLGKMIQVRVPLHMKEKRDSLYQAWFYFWRMENWIDRDGKSMTTSPSKPRLTSSNIAGESPKECPSSLFSSVREEKDVNTSNIPSYFYRFFIGSFYQPLDSIEQYFGENVAFYFAWLQHCSRHLIFLSVAGFIVTICQLSSGQWDHPIRPFFSMIIMLWSFFALVGWRQRQNELKYRWGNMDHKEQETTRPQFKGQYRKDELTGEIIVYYPAWKRYIKYLISFPITMLFTAGTLVLILLVHSNRDQLIARYIEQKEHPGSEEFKIDFSVSAIGKPKPVTSVELNRDHLMDPTFWFLMAGLPSLLGLFLPLLNFILMRISIMLNDFENYQTESHYRTALIVKVFSFRFVCYFATLYYYCFLSTGDRQAVENGIVRVGSGVIIYITVSHWWGVFLSTNFPLLIYHLRRRHQKKRLHEELMQVEREEIELEDLDEEAKKNDDVKEKKIHLINKRLLLDQAQDELWQEVMLPQHDSFPEYIQAVVQFAYITCFSAVLPITPIICLINHLISMRHDAYKLCKTRKRPLAQKTGGIGVWEHVLHIVSVIAVLTNCWLMGFTNEQFSKIADHIGQLGLFAIVVGWEHIMLLIKYVIQATTPKLPKDVNEAMRKEEYEKKIQRQSSIRAKKDRRSQSSRDLLSPSSQPARKFSSQHSQRFSVVKNNSTRRCLESSKGTRRLKTILSDDTSEGTALTPKVTAPINTKDLEKKALGPNSTVQNKSFVNENSCPTESHYDYQENEDEIPTPRHLGSAMKAEAASKTSPHQVCNPHSHNEDATALANARLGIHGSRRNQQLKQNTFHEF